MDNDDQERRILATKRFGVLAETRIGPQVATTLPTHLHEELQLILSEQRLISYGLKGSKVLSPLKSIFIIQPELPHSGHVHNVQNEWGALRTLLIPRSSFVHYLGDAVRSPSLTFSSPVSSSFKLFSLLRAMHDVLTGDQDALVSESIVTAALHTVLANAKTPPATPSERRSHAKMKLVRDYLGDNLPVQVGLRELAASVSLSPSHVLREFRLTYGMSPHAFRMQLRVGRARDLLLAKVPISDAAQLCGFADHAHLTRTFHKSVGVPPSRFRKQFPSRQDEGM